jgi:septum formation protein
MRLILASQSPRRKELLKEILPDFDIIPARGEEKGEGSPEELVKSLARHKAEEVSRLPSAKGKAVLGADTIVVSPDGEVLGKPKDEQDAFKMLSALSGKKHRVLTGVCLILPNGETQTRAETTDVFFQTLSEEEIKKYIASGSPMDKAGAYGIQDGGLVRRIEGSYTNVVGLPVELCREMLALVDFSAE